VTEAFRFTALARLHESDWKAAIASAATVLFLVLFGALFHGAANGAFQVWVVSPAFNHCFLVLPLSLFMIWQRRSTLVGQALCPICVHICNARPLRRVAYHIARQHS